MNPGETGQGQDQGQSGIGATAMNPGLDQGLSEIRIEVTDPELNQDQADISTAKDPRSDQDESRIRANAPGPASDRDAPGMTVNVTTPGLNQDQYGISGGASDPRSDHEMSGIRVEVTDPGTDQDETGAMQRSMVAMPGSTVSVRKGPRHVHEKHKGGAEAGCCRGESRWTSRTSSMGVIVEVREKRGVLRSAIPTMPFPLAVFCLVLNTFLPGMGTFVSAFAVLCGALTDQHHHHVCVVFLLNVASALIQLLTAVLIVGWIMSIFWGMDMVILATYRAQEAKDRTEHLTMLEPL
ncbi:protein stum homolog [Amblyraja radiata]|uniref:protein stum homolog n=1 Tax=Amblyraja radiata TaxID=386614 RepID=UPI001402B9D8|nr:protein stum homolog [Amblyraja radiata]